MFKIFRRESESGMIIETQNVYYIKGNIKKPIGRAETKEEVQVVISEYLKNKNYNPPYIRSWQQEDCWWYDVGSWSEFILWKTDQSKEENEDKMKELNLIIFEESDDYEGVREQSIRNKAENISFSVYNLSECPEDAIIGRDLFDAYDYVEALNKGIELAKNGYGKIVVTKIIENEE